jgi:predicted RNA-binding Zn-ribbon protein involved in translation (DUF1610 family)
MHATPAHADRPMPPLTTLKALRRELEVLAAVDQSESPFLSCYVDLERGPAGCRDELESRARALRATLPEPMRLDLDAALAPAASYLNEQLHPDARGAAIFSRSVYGGALFLPLQFAAPLPDALTVEPVPDLSQLIALQDRYHRYVVLLATQRSVSVLEVDLGAASLVASLASPTGKPGRGTQGRNEHTVGGKAWLAQAVTLLERVVAEGEHSHLMLVGDPTVTVVCRRTLPAWLRAILIATIPAGDHHAIGDIVSATTSVFVEWEEEESQAIAARFVDAVRSNGPAAVGASACFEALRARQAKLLLLARGRLPQPGWRCAACSAMRLRPTAPAACPECGRRTVWRTEATVELVRLARQRDCAVEFVEHCDPLMALGGVGCVLKQ